MSGRAAHYGIAGCGDMGLPMALALQKAGLTVHGFDIRPPEQFGDFADRMITNPTEFAARCDVVFCVVRDSQQVLDLCFDQQAIFAPAKGPKTPKTFVLSSTTPPDFVHQLAGRLPDNIALIDAPMSGAPKAATAATLTFMVGGKADTIKTIIPALQAMGEKIHLLGDLGAGMTAKVLNNFVAATTVVAVRNVLHQAKKLGMDQETLLAIMDQSSGQTWFGSNFAQINWADQTYEKTNTIGILEKDVNAFMAALPAGPEPIHKAVIEALRCLPDVPS